jgi:L,D-transpeptidase catalytic domain
MKMPALVAAIAVAAVGIFLAVGAGDDSDGSGSSSAGEGALAALRASIPLPDVSINPPPSDVPGPSFPLATVRDGRTVELRESPGGKVLTRVGPHTEFGSIRVFWVEQIKGDWFGVPAPELANGQLGWIRDDRLDLDVSETHYRVVADVSEQKLTLYYGNQVLDQFTVSVGSPGSPTPLGAYSVTDGLVGTGLGPWYGCCVLALSGHQPNLPPGWIGGNRIAIHGTPGTIGGAVSKGCLRASDPDMVSLFARVPLGAPVFIEA